MNLLNSQGQVFFGLFKKKRIKGKLSSGSDYSFLNVATYRIDYTCMPVAWDDKNLNCRDGWYMNPSNFPLGLGVD
jgi:hypothetical protein